MPDESQTILGTYAALASFGRSRAPVPWRFRERLDFKLSVHPDDIREAIRSARLVSIDPVDDRICAIQHTVGGGRLAQYVADPNVGGHDRIPTIVAFRGTWYLYDGHHRLTRAWLEGDSASRVTFADLDAVAKKKGTTRVQTLIFDRRVFTRKQAVDWAKTHDYKASDVDETEKSYRLRQRNPARFKPNSFRTIKLSKGVQATIGKLK